MPDRIRSQLSPFDQLFVSHGFVSIDFQKQRRDAAKRLEDEPRFPSGPWYIYRSEVVAPSDLTALDSDIRGVGFAHEPNSPDVSDNFTSYRYRRERNNQIETISVRDWQIERRDESKKNIITISHVFFRR